MRSGVEAARDEDETRRRPSPPRPRDVSGFPSPPGQGHDFGAHDVEGTGVEGEALRPTASHAEGGAGAPAQAVESALDVEEMGATGVGRLLEQQPRERDVPEQAASYVCGRSSEETPDFCPTGPSDQDDGLQNATGWAVKR